MTIDVQHQEEVLNPVIDADTAAKLADLDAGFDSVDSGETPKPVVVEEAPPETPAAEAIPEAPAEPAAPETIVLTKAQWEEAQAKFAKLEAETAKTAANFNGKFGEFNQTLRDLKAQPAGRKLTVEQFPKMLEQYGQEYVQAYVDDHNALLPAPVEAPAPAAAPTFDPETFKQELKAETDEKLSISIAKIAMASVDKDWAKTTSSKEFIAWRDAHPADVAETIRTTRDPEFLAQMLTGYHGHLRAQAEKTAPKPKTRLAAAITQQGAPPVGRQPKSDDDEFDKGFDSVV